MPGIVCPIRGGPTSRVTIDRAIDLANQTSLPLYFLYVVNVEFLSHTTTNRVQLAEDEISKMSGFILTTAQQRAIQKGISPKDGVIRVGNVADEIIRLCKEVQADYVVLGRPVEESDNSLFAGREMQNFLARIKSECEAEVILSSEAIS
jgi:nucleotide-binding universal stress UspA family protein